MDDYIKNNGVDKFKREVLEKALRLEAWEKQFASDTNGNSPRKPRSKPNPKAIAKEVASRFRSDWRYHNEQQTWRRFDGKTWKAIHENVFAEMVYQVVETICPDYDNYPTLKNVLDFLKLELLEAEWQTFPRHQWIAFNNVVLNLETGETHEHAPGFRFLSYLPRDYSPIAIDKTLSTIAHLKERCPTFYQWAMEAMEGDAQKVYKLASIINGVLRFKFFAW